MTPTVKTANFNGLLAMATPEDTLQIWDLQSGRVNVELTGHAAPIDVISWSPDGVWLATAARFRGIKVWDTHTGKVKVFGDKSEDMHHPYSHGPVGELIWAPDNRHLAVSYRSYNRFWIVDTDTGDNFPSLKTDEGETSAGYEFDKYISSMAWSRDSPWIAIGTGNNIVLLDPVSFEIKRTLTGHRLPICALQWGPNGQLASGGFDCTVKVWNSESGEPIRDFQGQESAPLKLSWNLDGTRLVSTGADRAIVWDLQKRIQSVAPRIQATDFPSVAWAPDSRRLVISDASHNLIVWDTRQSAEVARLVGHQDSITDVAWSPDGKRLASCSYDMSIRVWDADTGEELKKFESTKKTSRMFAIGWSPDGDRLVTGGMSLKLWDARTLVVLEEQPFDGRSVHYLIAWSPNGKLIATSGNRGFRVWDPQLRSSIEFSNEPFLTFTWGPDSEYLAVASLKGSDLSIWSINTPRDPITVMTGHTNDISKISWNAADDRIASASVDGSVKVWDPAAGKATITLSHPNSEPLRFAAWSPNGKRLLTVSEEGVVVIWDANKGFAEERLRVLKEKAVGEPTQQ